MTSEEPTKPPGHAGDAVNRTDGREKIRGEARYATDLERPNMLYAGVRRAQQPHAEITAVRTSAASALDDIAAVITREDLPAAFDNRVRHYGDVIAAVAGETKEAVAEALEAIEYDSDPLDSVHDPRESVRDGSPVVQRDPEYGQPERHPRNVRNQEYVKNVDDYHRLDIGDVTSGFEAADHLLEERYRTSRVNHCNLDRHCCLAEWDGGTLRITGTLGNPPSAERTLERLFSDVEDGNGDDIEVEVELPPTSGSSFGGRSLVKLTLEPIAGTLARETGRPVRLSFDREAEFTAADSRHATDIILKAGATDDGELTALKVDVAADTGPYPNGVGHIVLSAFENRPLDLYEIDNYRFEGVSAFTNNIPAGEYRGIGVTQITWALVSHLDELARQAGIDPIEFHRQNWVEEGYERPHTGKPVTSCGLRECLERGRETFEAMRSEPDRDGVLTGSGIGIGGQTTTPASERNTDYTEAQLVLSPDGSLVVRTGAVELGQGAETVLGQIAADRTGLPSERVTVRGYDSDADIADKYGSVANRTTYLMGNAVIEAAEDLTDTLRKRASDQFGIPPGEFTLSEGRLEAPNSRSTSVASLLTDPLSATGRVETNTAPISYGVHFAAVSVDLGTGEIDVTAFVAAQDVGFAINPTLVEGQLEGAIEHGIEFALLSDVQLEGGIPENPTLPDYPVSSPHEMPDAIACELIESNEESGPFGAKGVGTPSMPPVAPAITNAIRDAVGTRFTELPVRDEDVFFALEGEAQ
ncbi:MAG: xanthine dehydrogenase family protein molybdopterin-binding subunit [Halodesulfurarchaeum sp.]